jgi:hypothetical protein
VTLRARALCLALVAALLAAIFPGAAEACSVCLGSRDENSFAFIWTTAFLGALPLLMIGGVSYWLASRARALQAEERRELAAQRSSAGLESHSAS